MKTVIPNVRIAVEEAAMLNWTKDEEAEKPVFDAAGKLIPWEWKPTDILSE